jgi:tRNA 2-thiouridine synthesizing protein D
LLTFDFCTFDINKKPLLKWLFVFRAKANNATTSMKEGMMKYVLLLRHDTRHPMANHTAFHFAKTLLQMNHTLLGVFLMHESVHLANALAVPAQDEIDYQKDWATLAEKHTFEISVCQTAGIRRGVIDQAQAEQEGMTHKENIQPPYQLAGLGQFVALCALADRIMTFGGQP